ncbi:type IV secretion system protein [Erythrobacter sp. THAF29]|uniref:type IV secretion system protein n=1 Tax=Erythrobacter sp. THAF29 TaxID=2587851 RepID=UPI001268C2D4|nr:type IV secretion system protein [Erythrobacter sp. THAF29]QFT78513.1 TrbL/VirB6 plasmid conjugal transfer protein [Erythrobacter sp. THAF29]
MSCPAIITGDQFLTRVLTHIDCQAQVIGSYGYQALGQPGSTASVLVTGLLTLFIALFGIRLLFGPQPGARDVVFDVLKIGIVLTLAFSWPAFRTVVYDVTLKGPAEIASVIQTSSQPSGALATVDRLQQVDNNIVSLIELGTGRNTGQFLNQDAPGATFAGTALQDDAAFGYARLLFLAGVIAPLAMLRIAAAVLLALAPIVAGLYFFAQTRGILAGWAKGLVFTIGGSIAISLGLAVQLAIVEPWLADALNVRQFGYATPSAPLELFATMFAFMLVHFALLWVLARVVFHRGWSDLPSFPSALPNRETAPVLTGFQGPRAIRMDAPEPQVTLRAERLSSTIERSVRREETVRTAQLSRAGGTPQQRSVEAISSPRLGSSFRRTQPRMLRSIQKRDNKA